MAKTKEKLYDTADTMRPYVDRALHDDALHDNIKEAFTAARDVYSELLGNRNLTGTAVRAATDKDVQDNLKKAVEELRTAASRIQGKEDHTGRNTMLLLAGITAGLLFNPMTGPQTRQWLMEKITGDTADDYSYTPPSGSSGSNDVGT
jgi:gas vesicle protein